MESVKIRLMRNRTFLFLMLILFLIIPLSGQDSQRRQGPVLIKDFESPGEEEKVYPHDPAKARKNLEIGEYYFKRDNYLAAEARFNEALQYDKQWPEAYKKLIEAFVKQEKYGSAVEVCQKFAENNPESGELDYFRKEEKKYREKMGNEAEEEKE